MNTSHIKVEYAIETKGGGHDTWRHYTGGLPTRELARVALRFYRPTKAGYKWRIVKIVSQVTTSAVR